MQLEVKKSWSDWKLFTENGRQLWAYKSKANNLKEVKQDHALLSDEEICQMKEDFAFNKAVNPNSGDKVFRHLQLAKGFEAFQEEPKSEHLADKVEFSIKKGFHFFKHCLVSVLSLYFIEDKIVNKNQSELCKINF